MLKNSLTLVTPLNHKRSEPQQRPDSVTQAEKELPKRLTLYIPENFDIDEIIKNNPPDFKYHRDCFIYLVHLINHIPSNNKDVEMYYIPFYSALIQRRVRDYRKYLDYLVKNDVLWEDRQYIKGEKSRGFCLTNLYDTEIKPTYITKPTLIKSILKFIHLDNNQTNPEINQNNFEDNLFDNNLEYLTKWFNSNLTVDFIEAKKHLEKLREVDASHPTEGFKATRKFNMRYITLLKIHRGEFNHTIDATAGRMHTVLTQLKGELRQFIKYNGQTLIAIDITNSQPYLSTVLFNFEKFEKNKILQTIKIYNYNHNSQHNSNKLPYYLSKKVKEASESENVNQYIELVKSGLLYEEFGKILFEKGLINDDSSLRKQAKKIIFSSIFSPNTSIGHNKAIQIFKDYFPDVYEIYSNIKFKEHRTLACTLQNFEANLILHTACQIIANEKPEIPLFTLHDSIITTEGNEEYVYNTLFEVLLNAIGVPPTLKYEKWEKVA